tara:strand:+ start:1690 stop:3309 length:1620 start_codon:yes stop_codon:yes gene_type:complete
MCGIVSYISKKPITQKRFIVKCIKGVLSRGYDSLGVMTKLGVSRNIFKIISDVHYFDNQFEDQEHDMMIGHTRWATNGNISIKNTHPHIDKSSTFAIVHNGIITNHEYLVHEYSMHNLTSDTDTEVIVQLLAIEYEKCNDIESAFHKTLSKLEGTWAIIAIPLFIEYPMMMVHCHDMPLIVSHSDDMIAFASECSGLPFYEGTYSRLPNNKPYIITQTSSLDPTLKYTYFTNNDDMEDRHHTINEIKEQPRVIRELNLPIPPNERYKHLVIIGCGSSLFAANIAVYRIRQVKAFVTVQIIDGSNFDIHDLPNNHDVLVCFVSQSGETKELLNIAIQLDNFTKWCVVNNPNSSLVTLCDNYFDMNVGKENSVASTKSVTCQILYLQHLFGVHLNKQELLSISNDISLVIIESEKFCLDKFPNNVFILGNKARYGVAKEFALKLKELTYIHAEAFSNNALRHGPFTLLTSDTLCVIIDDYSSENIKHQIAARECPVLTIPYHENPIVQLIYCQILCYRIAVEQCKHNPDFPKNIAKVVSVD